MLFGTITILVAAATVIAQGVSDTEVEKHNLSGASHTDIRVKVETMEALNIRYEKAVEKLEDKVDAR